ncbi:hypothetical protein Hanom_Chr17g01526501 [Helianthus anomalus]
MVRWLIVERWRKEVEECICFCCNCICISDHVGLNVCRLLRNFAELFVNVNFVCIAFPHFLCVLLRFVPAFYSGCLYGKDDVFRYVHFTLFFFFDNIKIQKENYNKRFQLMLYW